MAKIARLGKLLFKDRNRYTNNRNPLLNVDIRKTDHGRKGQGFVKMVMQANDFESFIKRVSDGEEEAAWELVETYGPYVLRSVRRILDADIRSKFDSADFVQAVWVSFFSGRCDYRRLHKPEELVAFLTTMARNKLITELRRRKKTQKYDVRRELKTDPWRLALNSAAASRDPTPSQWAMARERWQLIMHNQPDHYQEIVKRRLRGETYQSIAEEMGLNERTVRRVLERILREQVA